MFPELFVGKRPRLSGNFFGLFQAVAPEFHYAGTVGVFKNFKPQSQLIGYGRHGQRFPVAVQDGAARRGNQQSHGPGGRARAGVRFPRGVQPSPAEGRNQGQGIQAILFLFRFPGHLRSGGHAFPFSGGRIGILFPVSQVNRFHSVILSALLHRSPASSRSPPRRRTARGSLAPGRIRRPRGQPGQQYQGTYQNLYFHQFAGVWQIYRKESTIIRAHAYS